MLTTAERFNERFPIGSKVWFHNGQSSQLTESRTTSKAFMAENGVLAVHVKSKSGMVPIAHITDAATTDCAFCKNTRRGVRLGDGFVPYVGGDLLCPRCFINLPEDSPLRELCVFGRDERKLTLPEPTPEKVTESPLMRRIEFVKALVRDFEKLLENNAGGVGVVKISEAITAGHSNIFSMRALNHRVKFEMRQNDLVEVNAHDIMREFLRVTACKNIEENLFFMVGEPKCTVELAGFYGDASICVDIKGFWVKQLL